MCLSAPGFMNAEELKNIINAAVAPFKQAVDYLTSQKEAADKRVALADAKFELLGKDGKRAAG